MNAPVSLPKALWRGFTMKCPNCGQGHLFGRFLKVVDSCEVCGEDYTPQRADDLPAYLVIAIVGHLVVPGTSCRRDGLFTSRLASIADLATRYRACGTLLTAACEGDNCWPAMADRYAWLRSRQARRIEKPAIVSRPVERRLQGVLT